MAASRRVLARAVADGIEGGADAKIIPKLAAFMLENGMDKHVEEVVGEIQYQLSQRGTVYATVTTARPLAKDLREVAESFVKKQLGAKKVVIDEVVDPDIVGGIIIETPTFRFDASIARELRKLKIT